MIQANCHPLEALLVMWIRMFLRYSTDWNRGMVSQFIHAMRQVAAKEITPQAFGKQRVLFREWVLMAGYWSVAGDSEGPDPEVDAYFDGPIYAHLVVLLNLSCAVVRGEEIPSLWGSQWLNEVLSEKRLFPKKWGDWKAGHHICLAGDYFWDPVKGEFISREALTPPQLVEMDFLLSQSQLCAV